MLHEIDERHSDGIRVTVYWQDEDDTLTIKVEDERDSAQDRTIVGVPPADHKLAFDHPFTYEPPRPSPFEVVGALTYDPATDELKGA